MRIGIFSDTHANIEALEVVLRALDDEAVDERVCLGDTVGYGASPNECCALIRSRTIAVGMTMPAQPPIPCRNRKTHNMVTLPDNAQPIEASV